MAVKVNLNGIEELDFPSGVTSATTANGVTTINLSGGGNLASVTVDFGFSTGNEGDTVTVTVPAAWVTANSKIICQVASVSTADHDPDDAAVEGIFALAQNLVPGVSFDIIAVAPQNSWGRYTIYAWGF